MSVPDVAVCETLLNQLRSGTVACSFVQVSYCECYQFYNNNIYCSWCIFYYYY